MPNALITTVIPTFRRPRWLKRAVESVLAQSFADVQVLICDNASGDETEAVAAEFQRRDARVGYIKNAENIGPINNMTGGARRVSTPYYSLLNDDDFLLPDFYEQAIAAFDRYPQAGFACAKTMVVDLGKARISYLNRSWQPGLLNPSIETTQKMRQSHFALPGVVFKTSLRDKIGAIERSGSDILHMTIASAQCPFVVLDSYQASFLVHGGSHATGGSFASDNLDRLQESLVDTVNNVVNLDANNELKTFLLTIVMSDYFKAFETRKLRDLRSATGGGKSKLISALPSRITQVGLLGHLYDTAPAMLRPLLTIGNNSAEGLASLRRRFKKRVRHVPGRSIPFTKELDEFFSGFDSDISRFQKALGRAEQTPR